MNDNQGRRGPGLWPLLLIPLAIFIAKGASRRRAIWAADGGVGHEHRFGARGFDPEGRTGFRMPPKIEAALDAWHDRAHETAARGDAAAASGTVTA